MPERWSLLLVPQNDMDGWHHTSRSTHQRGQAILNTTFSVYGSRASDKDMGTKKSSIGHMGGRQDLDLSLVLEHSLG